MKVALDELLNKYVPNLEELKKIGIDHQKLADLYTTHYSLFIYVIFNIERVKAFLSIGKVSFDELIELETKDGFRTFITIISCEGICRALVSKEWNDIPQLTNLVDKYIDTFWCATICGTVDSFMNLMNKGIDLERMSFLERNNRDVLKFALSNPDHAWVTENLIKNRNDTLPLPQEFLQSMATSEDANRLKRQSAASQEADMATPFPQQQGNNVADKAPERSTALTLKKNSGIAVATLQANPASFLRASFFPLGSRNLHELLQVPRETIAYIYPEIFTPQGTEKNKPAGTKVSTVSATSGRTSPPPPGSHVAKVVSTTPTKSIG